MKRFKCPSCSNKTFLAGRVHIRGVIKRRMRLTEVRYCRVCGWRGTR